MDKVLKLKKEERKAFLENEFGNNAQLLSEAKDYLYHIEKAEEICFLDSFSVRMT